MGFPYIFLALASTPLWYAATCEPIWPNVQTDVLEGLLYEQTGTQSASVAVLVKDCVGFGSVENGRSFGAEWLRNAYHDMATADVFAGTGGIDASIIYETERPENPGKGFNETLAGFFNLPTTRSSLSDLFALAAVFAVGACSNGTIILPFRAGRIDATGPGPSGVPQPQEDLASHTASFSRQGFNASEMIALVACGHTIGGVHGVDFPEIVPFTPDGDPNNDHTANFDVTPNFFENRVATEFISNTTLNPLVNGDNVTTRSDLRIFESDGGVMIGDLAQSNDYFLSTCSSLLERMINTVPKEVILTEPIDYYPVKPWFTGVEVNLNGTLTVSGVVRVENRLLPASNPQVRLHFASSSGGSCSEEAPCTITNGTTSPGRNTTCVYPNCPASFTFFDYSIFVPIEQGASAYAVEVVDSESGTSVIHDNGGKGFPVAETLLPQYALSTETLIFGFDSNGNTKTEQRLDVTVAVLNAEQYTDLSGTFYRPNTVSSTIISGWTVETVPFTFFKKVEGTNYTYYNVSYTQTSGVSNHPFDLTARGPGVNASNNFIGWNKFKVVIQFG